MSLLSPQGIHPTASTSLRDASPTLRKCSLIKEESVEEGNEADEDADLELENYTESIRESKSVENLDFDDLSNNASPTMLDKRDRDRDDNTSMFVKRPLLSVASSPQLLNQICEENESEEDEDFVPARLNAHSRMLTKRNSVASPEVIRKYEQRRKHRTSVGSRGTSCSSSDASDTDDTEGRSRKDKLKHKFIHRRDSSDHSSDTDGGPSGHGNGGFGKGLGGGTGGGNGGNGGNDRKGGDDRGDGGGKKDKKGGSPKNGRSHHGKGKQNHVSFKVGGGRISECSNVSNSSQTSLKSRSSLKYVVERDENVSDSDAEDNADTENEQKNNDLKRLRESLIEKLNLENKKNKAKNLEKGDFNSSRKSSDEINKLILSRCSPTCSLSGTEKNGHGHTLGLSKDINSNMSCKQSCNPDQISVKTKCCSLV